MLRSRAGAGTSMHEQATFAADKRSPTGTIAISVRGRWVNVPAITVNGQTIVVKGKRIKIASLHDEDWLEKEVIDPEECVQRLKGAGEVSCADIFSFSQKVPETVPRYSYPMEMRSIAVTNIASFENWWKKLPKKTRGNVRRSQKRGVTIKVQGFDDEVIRGVMSVQNESPIRQGRRFYHYGKSYAQVRHDHGDFLDRSDFICAYYGDELIGFLKLVYRGDVASILQINSKLAHYDKRASNALIAKAAELCAARGISYMIYGLFNYGKKQDDSLREFKSRNGFEEMLVPTYYIPLTAWGAFCVRTKLYRGVIGILPSGLISAGLGLRSRWYSVYKPRERLKPALDGRVSSTQP